MLKAELLGDGIFDRVPYYAGSMNFIFFCLPVSEVMTTGAVIAIFTPPPPSTILLSTVIPFAFWMTMNNKTVTTDILLISASCF